jgi:L-amino acid N-acyltransferase YncA
MIRPVRDGDAGAIAAIYAPIVERTAISFETDAPGADEIARRIVEITKSHPWLVSDEDDEVHGYAYAAPYHPRPAYGLTAEVSVYVDDETRGTGQGRALLRALLEELTTRGFVNAMARIALPNPASVTLFESEGFKHNGVAHGVGFKLDRWHDVGEWQKVLS